MRADALSFGLMPGRPALEILPRWKPWELGDVYGDCVLSVDARVVFGDRLALLVTTTEGVFLCDFVGRSIHCASISAAFKAGIGSAHFDRAGSACCSRDRCLMGDRRSVMRLGPLVVRAPLVFDPV